MSIRLHISLIDLWTLSLLYTGYYPPLRFVPLCNPFRIIGVVSFLSLFVYYSQFINHWSCILALLTSDITTLICLPRDAMLARYIYCHRVFFYPSVRHKSGVQ